MGGPPPPFPPLNLSIQIHSETGINTFSPSHPPGFTPPVASTSIPRPAGPSEDTLAYVQMLEQQQEQTNADVAILKMEMARIKASNRPAASHSDSQGRHRRRNFPPPPPLGENDNPRRISVHDRLDPPLTANRVEGAARFGQQRPSIHKRLGGGISLGGADGRREGSPHTVYSSSTDEDEYSQGSQSYDTVELLETMLPALCSGQGLTCAYRPTNYKWRPSVKAARTN